MLKTSLLLLLAVAVLEASTTQKRTLIASWYGYECSGRMANGKQFDPMKLTCASWDYDLGTKLTVTHVKRSVNVEVTDRGPAKRLLNTRQIDLSMAAFDRIADTNIGLISVEVQQNKQ